MAFVELSLAITPAYVISLSLSLSPAKLIFFLYVIWGFKDDRSGAPKAAGDPYCTLFVCRIFHLTSGETLREVRVCVVYVELRACGWSDTLAKALQLLCFMILLMLFCTHIDLA